MRTLTVIYKSVFPDLRVFWEVLNLDLEKLGEAEANYGEASYWYRRRYSPETAARLTQEDRREAARKAARAAVNELVRKAKAARKAAREEALRG